MNEKAMDEAERRLTARRLVQGTEAQTGAGECVDMLGREDGWGRRGGDGTRSYTHGHPMSF
jgi:hypothetical protein